MGMGLSLLGTAASMGGSLASNAQRQREQKQQEQDYQNWYMSQAMLRHQEMMRQRGLGFEAANAFRQNLYDTAGGLAQASQQQKEQNRLQGVYASGTSASEYAQPASDASIQAGSQRGALTGQSGGDGEFRTDLARRLNNAAGDAKNKIAALATMNSYGNSQFGLGNVVPLGFQQAGWTINQKNDARRGSLNAYQVEKQISPRQVQHKESPAGQMLSGVGGLLGGLGKSGMF